MFAVDAVKWKVRGYKLRGQQLLIMIINTSETVNIAPILNGACSLGICRGNSTQLSPEGQVNSVDIYRDAKRGGIHPPLFTDPKGDSCVSIYQNQMDKKTLLQFLLLKLSRNEAPFFSLFAKNEYPRIFPVTGANQNARKLLSTDLLNTNIICSDIWH